MRIIVAGAGKLGYSIAQLLAEKQYDVVVVEPDQQRVEHVQNSLDVLALEGNACDPAMYNNLDLQDADMLIACTDSDEANMVTCILAKKYGIKNTVGRIRNVEYATNAKEMLHTDMKLDMILNPERLTAKDIFNRLATSGIKNFVHFANGKVRIFENKLGEDSPYIKKPLKELNLPQDILVAMVFRNHQMIIPRGNDVLQPGDNVYFVGKQEAIKAFEKKFVKSNTKVQKIVLIGAGRCGRILAPMLEEKGFDLKVIERNKERCALLAGKLEKSTSKILCNDATEIDFLLSEGVDQADVVVCLTEDDKLNLMLAQLVKHLGDKDTKKKVKTIVRVARNEYVDLMEKVGVDIVVSSRFLSCNEVYRFVRRGGILSTALLEDGQAEALEIMVGKNSQVEGKALRDLALPHNCLLCSIVRQGEAYVPNGNTVLQVGDRVVLFIASDVLDKIVPMFKGRSG